MDSDEGPGTVNPSTPTVWVLLDDRPGNSTQSMGLAECLGWPFEIKKLVFFSSSTRWFSPSGIEHVDAARSSVLAAPWPDLVIAAGQRTAPVSKWIKSQSQGRTKIVHLGRKGGLVMDDFDLVVTPRYCQLPSHPKRMEITVPLNRVTPEKLLRAKHEAPDVLKDSSRLRIVLLVGGATPKLGFNETVAVQMGEAVRAFAEAHNGRVFALTSRRTTNVVADALETALGDRGQVFRWDSAQVTIPYLSALSLADVIVVTGDSESMMAEVAATDKPMFIYPLPIAQSRERKKRNIKKWIKRWVFTHSSLPLQVEGAVHQQHGPVTSWCTWLFERGYFHPPRRLDVLHQDLFSKGVARQLGASFSPEKRQPLSEAHNVAHFIQSHWFQ